VNKQPQQTRLQQGPPAEGRSGHDQSGWQIVYTGFILIMLTFFIMLSSFSSLEQSKITQFAHAFSNAVNIFTGGLNLSDGSTLLPRSVEMVHKEQNLSKLIQDITRYASSAGLDQIELSLTDYGVVMTLPDTALFASGVAQVTPSALPVLKEIATIIKKTSCPIRIEGHTDDRPIATKRYPSNWELSTARAVSVLRYFLHTAKIPSPRLAAAGFGEYHPVAANDSAEHRARNRRVEIIFCADDESGGDE
jgi:chemotaxis protein MotB